MASPFLFSHQSALECIIKLIISGENVISDVDLNRTGIFYKNLYFVFKKMEIKDPVHSENWYAS